MAATAPARGVVTRHAWMLFLAAGGVLLALYLFVAPLAGSGPVMNLLGLAPVLAIVAGLRLHRPGAALAWVCFALGFTLFWLGDLYTYSYPLLLERDVPFPSLGDGAYLAVYPALMAGLLILQRRRAQGGDRGSAIDASIMIVGLALPSWIWLIAPYIHDDSLSTVGRLVSVAYPLADVLLLAVAVRLALDGGQRRPAFNLMSASIICLLVTDFVYGLMILHGTYDHQLWLDAGWIGFYLLWGAAALHPSMSDIDQPTVKRGEVLTRFRLVLLSGASLVAPVIGMLHDLHVGDYDFAVVRAGSIVLFGLVVSRMAGLVRQQERSLERERMLSAAGADLVAATGREEIDEVALTAARAMAGPDLVTLLCSVSGDGSVRRLRPPLASPRSTPRAALPATAELLDAARDAGVVRLRGEVLAELGLPDDHDRVLALDLAPPRRERMLLVVAGRTAPPEAIRASLRALAAQVALGLERAALTEEVHRRRGEARFGSLVRHASDLITVIGLDGTISYQSPSIERLLGYAAEDVTGQPFAELVHPSDGGRVGNMLADGAAVAGDQPHVVQCTLMHRDGTPQQFEVNYTNLLDDEHVGGIVLNCRDISERNAFEEQLTHQAFHDPVTGLANRALFGERVRHAIARGRRENHGIAVVFLDLDDFKTINDSLGHAAGDQVLAEVAKRLATSVRASDTAARFGGDEFALLLEDTDGVQEAADTAERVLEALAVPMRVGHKELSLRCSIGISVVSEDGSAGAEELIRDADAAMYRAKRDGKGSYRLFEPEMHEGVLARLELRTDLQRAIATEQLELHYQPVVRLEDGSISGVEALLRWRHPERGMIPPDQFIPLAEETGLIVPIGRWVLREGCRQARRMRDALPPEAAPTMSINLSVKQLQHSDVIADVGDAVREAGIEPSALTLEITETVLMADTDLAVTRLRELKALGVRLALDDFGTGYSSLSALSRFPVDILKMDRSFLRDGATPETSELASAVLALGTTLNLRIVAEGVELPEQWRSLRDLGCEFGQGFFFARPMDADAMLEHLAARLDEGPLAAALPRADAP
ncbi:MAG TPA: EAL domain-containing protein [Thermoleophilaceae bacterium]|nr:EAL domain-containing protein [Thermoleophilaceae bacterium]